MFIGMLKSTWFDGVMYAVDTVHEVDDNIGKRWVKNKIAQELTEEEYEAVLEEEAAAAAAKKETE